MAQEPMIVRSCLITKAIPSVNPYLWDEKRDDITFQRVHFRRRDEGGIREGNPGCLSLSATLDGCARRYQRFCQRYRHQIKAVHKCHWVSRMLKRLVSSARTRSKKNRF